MTNTIYQQYLPFTDADNSILSVNRKRSNGQANKLDDEDRAIHDWYRFVLSYPPHLVKDYIKKFSLNSESVILDPFCGTGTTLVVAKLLGIPSVGLEANPFAHFASSVKINWDINISDFFQSSREIESRALSQLIQEGIEDAKPFTGSIDDKSLKTLPPEASSILITNSISPIPLHKLLTLLEYIQKFQDKPYYFHLLLSLANALVFKISNLHFGPEVGVAKIKADAPVISAWLSEVDKMIDDINSVSQRPSTPAKVYLADSRNLSEFIPPQSIDAIITSPPYPNEKDYTRTTRLESVVLGFINNKSELRQLKKTMIRSNTRGVYKGDNDDQWVTEIPDIQRIASQIEQRRVELGKNSGFEKLYGKVTKLYFGGMARHLEDLKKVLKPGAHLAYVVGDQASYLRVMIRTGELIGQIAQGLGYELEQIDLFRTRFATASQDQLREEVVVLRWPGQEKP